MNKLVYFTIITAISLAGCITSDVSESIITQAPDVIMQRVADAYENDKPERALSILQGAKGRYPEKDWSAQWNEGVTLLSGAFSNAVAKEDWTHALIYYRSLNELDEETVIEAWDEDALLKNKIMAEVKGEYPIVGLTAVVDHLDRLSFTDDEYRLFLETAEKEKHSASINSIRKAMGEEVPNVSSLSVERTRQLLKGMVTVWVDRGIKLEQGMGFPDRVIGSGFFIDSRGFLLTNYHVISSEVDPKYEGYSRLFIRLASAPKERIPARVVGWDPLLDLALLKVEYTPGYVFSLNEVELGPGQQIYAIGSPGGLESTITSGIVSATDRRLLQIGDTTQIDVPINHGNSGGPLIDSEGNVVGVVFAGIESFEGINFAIPGKWVNLVLEQLYKEEVVKHPWLGVAVYERPEGLEVLYVFPESPAEFSGIVSGDILTGVGTFRGNKIGKYQYEFLQHESGEIVTIFLNRADKEMRLITYFGIRPESPVTEAAARDAAEDLLPPLFGFNFETAGTTLWEKRYRITRILNGMAADETGLSVNDPFILQNIKFLFDEGVVLTELQVKKRKAGFMESTIQLAVYMDTDYFL